MHTYQAHIRRSLSLLLCAVMLLSLAGCTLPRAAEPSGTGAVKNETPVNTEPVLLVDGMGEQPASKPAADLMDFMYFAQASFSFEPKGSSGTQISRKFSADASSLDIIKEYITLLCSSYQFEIVGEPYYYKYDSAFFDYVLRYTGEKKTTGGVTGTFSKNSGDFMIYGTIEHGRIKGYYYYDYALAEQDDGYRAGNHKVSASYIGESISTGLYRLANGDYQTQDGRFTAKINQAVVLSDGKESRYDARYEIDIPSQRLRVIAENQYDFTMQHFYIPTSEEWEVGIYDAEKFIIDASYANKDGGVHGDSVPSYIWPTMFTHFHNKDYVYPCGGLRGEMTGLNLRLIYRDETAAVFYSCATYKSAPYTIETFIAVSTDVVPKTDEHVNNTSNNGDSGYTDTTYPCAYCSESGACKTCGGTGLVKSTPSMLNPALPKDCPDCTGGDCRNCGGKGWWS